MSILRESIQSEIKMNRDLFEMQIGLDTLLSNQNVLQEWNIVQASKNLARGIKNLPSTIKDLPNYRMVILNGKDGKWFLTRDMGKFEAVFVANDGTATSQSYPVSEFENKAKEINKQGYEIVRDYNGVYKVVKWFLLTGVKRGTVQLLIGGIIALLVGLVAFFPSLATISILGTTIGSLAGVFGATVAMKFAGIGVISIAAGKVAKKKLHPAVS
jgi:hypothetical protein